MFKYFLYCFSQFLFQILPIRLSYIIAGGLSKVVHFVSFRDRSLIKKNLQVIVGADNHRIHRYTREVFRNFGFYLVEFLLINQKVNKKFIDQKVEIKGQKYLDEVLAGNKGGIILTAHIGNWELGAVILSLLGYDLVAVALAHKEKRVNDLFVQQRQAKGLSVVEPHHAIRKCTQALKDNRFVALVGDRDFTKTGKVLDFLNRKTLIPKGPAMFALKTGAPIIPVFLVRNEHMTFSLEVFQPIDPKDFQLGLDKKENVRQLMEHYIKIIETKIRQFPSQWIMFQKYWIDD